MMMVENSLMMMEMEMEMMMPFSIVVTGKSLYLWMQHLNGLVYQSLHHLSSSLIAFHQGSKKDCRMWWKKGDPHPQAERWRGHLSGCMRVVLLPTGSIGQCQTKKLRVRLEIGYQVINFNPALKMTLKSPS